MLYSGVMVHGSFGTARYCGDAWCFTDFFPISRRVVRVVIRFLVAFFKGPSHTKTCYILYVLYVV